MRNLNHISLDYNNATMLLNAGKYKKAAQIYKSLLKEYPCKEVYTNLGNCYRKFGQDKEMFNCYKMALTDSVPFLDVATKTHLHALNNLGLANFMYGRDDDAISLYRTAIAEEKDFWDCRWNMSTALLRKASTYNEGWEAGWANYESRFVKATPVKMKNSKENLYYWDKLTAHPEDSVIVLVEQGIGDALMFGRYISGLSAYFKKIYVQCDPSLDVFFAEFNPVRDAIDTSAVWAVPLCSLAGIFNTVPAADWFKSTSTYDFGPGFNVGIVWAGNPTHANDAYRSTTINRFHGLARYCNLYSLTPGFKGNKHVRALDIGSWSDTIAYINGLDLVITIDSSVAHLAGVLGARTYLLQPYKETDFRWGVIPSPSTVSTRSVWYPNIEIFNNPQSWEFVFANVENYVKHIAS